MTYYGVQGNNTLQGQVKSFIWGCPIDYYSFIVDEFLY